MVMYKIKSLKQRKVKFKSRIKLNHNIYNHPQTEVANEHEYRRTLLQGCHKEARAGDFPGYYEHCCQLLSKENKRKIEPEETSSCLIPCLLVVFTQFSAT